MIHPYNDYYLPVLQNRLGDLFEIALVFEKIEVNEFENIFINSIMADAFETNNMKYTLGKSSSELLSIIMNNEPKEYNMSPIATPEYWSGYVLCYISWYFNVSFKYIFKKVPLKELIMNYFPYHEMDIKHLIDFYKERLNIPSKLKIIREKNGLSQKELAVLTNIPIRTIKSYEQKTVDISKAQVETVYVLARELNCKIEDLI